MDDAQFLEELKQDFFSEAQTLIENLETNILVIEKEPTNEEAINEIFRAAHTLKGGSSTLDLDRIASFTHEMENLLEEVRSGTIKLTPDLVDLLLKSIDIVKTLVLASQEGREQEPGYENEVINAIKLAAKTKDGETPTIQVDKPISISEKSGKIEITLGEYERYAIKKATTEGYGIYQVYIKLDSSNPMKTVSGLQIHSQLKDISEILKSLPDIDDLMSDQFFEEVVFIIQSTYTKKEIYNKVFLSDVTQKVEVTDFVDELEEDEETPVEDIAVDLIQTDVQEIQTEISQGKKVFKIIVIFDDSNPMRSVSGILFFTMLRTKGEVLKSTPTYEEFKEDTFYPKGEFIFSTTHNTQELRNKLFLSDITKELKFQEFQNDPSSQAPSEEKQQSAPPVVNTPVAETVPANNVEHMKVPEVIKPGNQKAEAPAGNSQLRDKKQVTSFLRVESARIDDMLNLVGELVIIKASFFQINDHTAASLDEFTNMLNQYKTQIRQLGAEFEEIIDGLSSNGSKGKSSGSFDAINMSQTITIEPDKAKDLIKEKINTLINHFSTLLPDYKILQDKLKGSSQSLGRITDDLQESVMKVRMVQINQVFSRFPRLVRDISKNLKKEIELVMEGEDTELDKSVIEDLVDPLIHIVRNSVDHGIEFPEERKAKNKNTKATVLLKAEHEGNTVTITVRDDGRGINVEKVRAKAIENNLIDPNVDLPREELINLIFEPGFSTADEVTGLSGRGVGLDIVKKKIENLGGTVEVESTEGMGSIFTIKIPLTLAIIQALLVQVGDYIYSIPINSVIETLRVGPEDIEILESTEVIRVREEVLSLVRLEHLFKHQQFDREDEYFYVISVGTSGKKVGLGVDNLVGEQDIVIKPLNNKYTNVQGIAGATILGDGQVSLVLDVASLFSLISSQRKNLLQLNTRMTQ